MNRTKLSRSAARKRNRFPYGWRYVFSRVNGREELEQIPLTLEDVLYPQQEDCIPQSSAHNRDCAYLNDVFDARLPKALILHDCLIEWDVPGLRDHSPDLAVIFGVRRKNRLRRKFVVAKERARPFLLIEVVSPDTRVNDVKRKVTHYHKARVPFYVIVDRKKDEDPPALIGYKYSPEQYVRMDLDADGCLRLERVPIRLGIRDNRVVCYDGKTGKELGDYARVSQELEASEEARRAAEERIRDLERQLRRRNGKE